MNISSVYSQKERLYMKKVKILVGFIMDGKAGGIDKYLLNFLEQVHNECVQVDFLTNHIDANLKQKLEQYDSHLYEVANLKQPNLQYRQICDIIQKNKYDVTYFNISTAISRIGPQAAFDCNVPIRVIHSHSTGNDCSNPYKRKLLDFLHNKYKKQLYKTANRFYACSKKAGLWMFPESIVESDKFKVIHNAPNTSSVVNSKSISKDGGACTYRALVRIAGNAKNSKCSVSCESLMLDDISRSDTIPVNDIRTDEVEFSHEAKIGKISDKEIFYLMSRGLSEEDAKAMIVRGFAYPISNELPVEYAVEMNNLINLELKGSIG